MIEMMAVMVVAVVMVMVVDIVKRIMSAERRVVVALSCFITVTCPLLNISVCWQIKFTHVAG